MTGYQYCLPNSCPVLILTFLSTQAITTPAMAVSHIMLESYKKYILVSLILLGKVQQLPKYTSQIVGRFIKVSFQNSDFSADMFCSYKAVVMHNSVIYVILLAQHLQLADILDIPWASGRTLTVVVRAHRPPDGVGYSQESASTLLLWVVMA